MWIADEDGALTAISWSEPSSGACRETALTVRAAEQLREYFAGERRDFDLPLRLSGTDFQRRVWDALCTIPYGSTRTYGEIARACGSPGAPRAVGQACNRNPVSIAVPCHRVVGAGGLTGYAGGLESKKILLELEQAFADIVRRHSPGFDLR